jgi:hypothetical protein
VFSVHSHSSSQQKHGAFKLETCACAGCNRAVKQHGQHFCDIHLGNGGSKKASKQRDISANGATRVELATIRGLHKRMNRASLSVRVKQRNRRVAMKQKSSKSTHNKKEWNHGFAALSQHCPKILVSGDVASSHSCTRAGFSLLDGELE